MHVKVLMGGSNMKKMIIIQHCHMDEDKAIRIANKLKDENPDLSKYKLLTSDREKVLVTTNIIGENIQLQSKSIKELRERDTECETDRKFSTRVRGYMNQLYGAGDEYLILITHSDTLSNILTWWMGLDQGFMNKVYNSVKPGSISVIEKNSFGQRVLTKLNDLSHLL